MGQWVGNYGVAIIILVIVVRVLLHPLTKKSQVSMMGMQKLKPQMDRLKAKYGDVIQQDAAGIKFKVTRDRVIPVCKLLFDELPVTDIDIQEVPIEDVIRQIFAR